MLKPFQPAFYDLTYFFTLGVSHVSDSLLMSRIGLVREQIN
jgi:hypothetical protein